MQTKVMLIGSGEAPSMFHTRIMGTLEHSPEYLIIYINQDNVDKIKGLDYNLLIYDELIDLECIERCRGITVKGRNVNVGTIGHPDWYYDPAQLIQFEDCMSIVEKQKFDLFDTKHTKPFYHKGRW